MTARVGLRRIGWASSVCAGDYDNDGWIDLFVTYFGQNVLYRNRGGGRFEDVTARARARDGRRRDGDPAARSSTTTATAGSICSSPTTCGSISRRRRSPGTGANCMWKGVPVNCGPKGLPTDTNLLYRNRGDGTFADVSERVGHREA